MSISPVMTRAAGLEALTAFLAGPGADYAAACNTDRGPLRGRLLTEEEVARAAIQAFGERGAVRPYRPLGRGAAGELLADPAGAGRAGLAAVESRVLAPAGEDSDGDGGMKRMMPV